MLIGSHRSFPFVAPVRADAIAYGRSVRPGSLVLELYRTYEIAFAILYGGGYNRTPGETGRLHAATIALAYQYSF